MDWIQIWALAIAQFEGFNSPGSRPARNHNPGDLKYAGQAGASGQDAGGFAIFPDDATGFQALYRQLNKYVAEFPGFSILEIMAHYLGQSIPTSDAQGNAFAYADEVAAALGVATSTTLGDLAAAAAAAASAVTEVSTPPAEGSSGDGSPDNGGPSGGQIAGMLIGGALTLWAIGRLFGW